MEPVNLPPPPYSEMDTYSSNISTSPSVTLTPTSTTVDHQSTLQSSPPRSAYIDTPITYTPPETPSGSPNEHNARHAASSISTALEVYFNSRPAIAQATSPPTVYSIAITANTKPEDIGYPEPVEDFLAKDVKPEDWLTFTNYLLPDHYIRANNNLADRKWKAEEIEERMHQLTLQNTDLSRTILDEVRAQLEPLRSEPLRVNAPQNTARAIIESWNEGFFLPRGIRIRLIGSELAVNTGDRGVHPHESRDRTAIPETWASYDHKLPCGMSVGITRSNLAGNSGGFSASSNRYKIGPDFTDKSGVGLDYMPMVGYTRLRGRRHRDVADQSVHSTRRRSFDQRVCHKPDDYPQRKEVHDHSRRGDFHARKREDHCGYERGRGRYPHRGGPEHHENHFRRRRHRRRGRDSSTSSSSSSSSSSSAESSSSIGSLPDYDELPDQQIYNARKALLDWLNHPDQPITSETVRNFKENLKLAEIKASERPDQDFYVLRKEVKDLMKKFKERKRTERNLRRNLHRQKRAAKKAAKREQKVARRQERRGRRIEKGKCKSKNDIWNLSTWMKMPAPPTMGHKNPLAFHPLCSTRIPRRGFPLGIGLEPSTTSPCFGRTIMPPTRPGHMHVRSSLPEYMYSAGIELGAEDSSASIAQSAATVHYQAMQMDLKAVENEKRAIELRTEATGHDVPEPVRVAKKREATVLEEVATTCRREAKRLGAEGLLLDERLARDLCDVDEGAQQSGVIQYD